MISVLPLTVWRKIKRDPKSRKAFMHSPILAMVVEQEIQFIVGNIFPRCDCTLTHCT